MQLIYPNGYSKLTYLLTYLLTREAVSAVSGLDVEKVCRCAPRRWAEPPSRSGETLDSVGARRGVATRTVAFSAAAAAACRLQKTRGRFLV